jgi:hypothetical protein
MNTIVDKLTKVSSYIENDSFKDYIAISCDSLLVVNKDLELVEWIIEGNSTDGIYMSTDTEDDFLDAIVFFKNIILSGNNPLDYI